MSDDRNAYAYADISSLSEILKVGPSRKILECMTAFREAFPAAADRLIYGSDWSMIAQSEGFPRVNAAKPFPDMMVTFLRAAGYDDTQVEGIMFRNASRFLGLEQERARPAWAELHPRPARSVLRGPSAQCGLDEGVRLSLELRPASLADVPGIHVLLV